MTKIVLTKWIGTPVTHGRIYIDKERIIEVHESSDGKHCTIVLKAGKDPEYYDVCESFDEVKALIDFEPAVADIVIKGKELS
jgi:hypothetical protein